MTKSSTDITRCGVANPGGTPCTKTRGHEKGHDPAAYGPSTDIPILDDDAIRRRLAAHRREAAKYRNHEWAKGDALHYYEAPDDVEFLLAQLEQVTKERDDLRGDNGKLSSVIFNNKHAQLTLSCAIALCRDKAAKYKALANDSLPNDQTGARLAASARTLEEFAAELEQLK